MALMYHSGYRPARDRGSQHLNVQQFVESEFADDFDPGVLGIFGKARQGRHAACCNMTYLEPPRMQM